MLGDEAAGKLVDSATVLHPSHASTAPAGAADLTRQRLIRAALELFTTRGYHDTTTAQIAKKAGIAEGTIYRHFASKQQLMNELIAPPNGGRPSWSRTPLAIRRRERPALS